MKAAILLVVVAVALVITVSTLYLHQPPPVVPEDASTGNTTIQCTNGKVFHLDSQWRGITTDEFHELAARQIEEYCGRADGTRGE